VILLASNTLDDAEIFMYALETDFVIVSKDAEVTDS